MNNKPYISVVIPVRNGSEHIDKCLRGFKGSTYEQYEVIVVDDASTDGTAEVAERAGAKVLRLKEQSGPAAARNRGAEEAQGDIILFVDADVVINQDTIEQNCKRIHR